MTEQEIRSRIKLLVDEINANEDENRQMEDEIDDLYEILDKTKETQC